MNASDRRRSANDAPRAAAPATPNSRPLRGEPRAPHRLPCRVRLFDPASSSWVVKQGQTVNVSSYGLAVQVGLPVAPGTRVEAVVPRFDAEPLEISGTVRHSRRVLAGTFELGIHAHQPLLSDA